MSRKKLVLTNLCCVCYCVCAVLFLPLALDSKILTAFYFLGGQVLRMVSH